MRWKPAGSRTDSVLPICQVTQLGGTAGFPVDIKIFNPLETQIAAGRLDAEIREQVEMGAELLPAARRGTFDCLLCRKRSMACRLSPAGWRRQAEHAEPPSESARAATDRT
jgi:hypothetical protein